MKKCKSSRSRADGTAKLTVFAQRGDRSRVVLCDADSHHHPIGHWVATRGPGVHHLAHRVGTTEVALSRVEQGGGAAVGGIVESAGLRQVFTRVADDGLVHELTKRLGTQANFVQQNTQTLIATGAGHNATAPPAAAWRKDRR